MTRRYTNNEYSESIAEAPLLTGIHRVGDPCFNGVSGKALESLWIVVLGVGYHRPVLLKGKSFIPFTLAAQNLAELTVPDIHRYSLTAELVTK